MLLTLVLMSNRECNSSHVQLNAAGLYQCQVKLSEIMIKSLKLLCLGWEISLGPGKGEIWPDWA